MKRLRLIATGVGLAAIAIFAADASAFYHPGMGAFLQRDPGAGGAMRIGAGEAAPVGQFIPRDPTVQYADGPNLYQYVGGNPVNRVDPTGLKWTIRRNGQPRAWARADCDPIEDLAATIGLDKDEWTLWLSPWGPASPGEPPKRGVITGNEPGYDFQVVTVNGKVMAKGQFAIPNTILAAWAGWEVLGQGVGQFYVMWGKDISDLKAKGFAVHEVSNVKAAALLSDLKDLSRDAALHGVLFWGHGGPGGLTTKESENSNLSDDYYLRYLNVKDPAKGLRYKLAFGMVYSCFGNRAKAQMMSPGAAFWGGPDLLIPAPLHWNAPTVEQLLSGKE